MIDLDLTLDRKHVLKIVGEDKNKQDIFEKYVHSMKLLEQLPGILEHKHYVFKGGTSLLVLFKENSRFSIDVDICMNEEEFENRDLLERLFKDKIAYPFIGVERDRDRKSHAGRQIKAAHYRFFYNPRFKTDENYVLLDVTFQNNSIQGENIFVDNPKVIQDGEPKQVYTIMVNDLLGDKLTAFAPNTIGVKYEAKNQFGRPKCTEIIKQLTDCACLSSHFDDIDRVTSIYREIANYQISYENKKQLKIKDCLVDTIKTCELLLTKGKSDKIKYDLLLSGVNNFNDYRINGKITEIDVQKYAFVVDIIASKLLKKIYPTIKREDRLDFEIRNGLKEKELRLVADPDQLEEFYANCLLSI